MYIRKATVAGIKGIGKKAKFDFSPSDNSKFFEENIEDFGITKGGDDFRVLKQIALIGLNSSGKSSALIGIQSGLAILANPFNNMQALKREANVFWNKPFSWNFEIVTKLPEEQTPVARKYKIHLELFKNEIIKESVSVIESSKTSQKDEFVIYELDGKKLKAGSKTYNHNAPGLTVFSLIRTGQINKDILSITKKYNDLFLELNWFNENPSNAMLMMPFQFTIPSSDAHMEKLNNLMEALDPKFVKLETDQFNNPVITIKQNGELRKVEGFQAIYNILSKGTMETLKLNHSLFTSITSKGISFFDEIDHSMHAGMFGTILEILRKTSKAQMIFTTHNTDIFSQNLRLDQINIIKNDGDTITSKRVADFKGVSDRDATLKKIKRAINNSPDSEKVMRVVTSFAS